MRVRWVLHMVDDPTPIPARSLQHALELAAEHPGRSWQVTVQHGAGDPVVVRRGVGRFGGVDAQMAPPG